MPSFEKRGEIAPAKALSRSPTTDYTRRAQILALSKLMSHADKEYAEMLAGSTRANFTPAGDDITWQWCRTCDVYHKIGQWIPRRCLDKDWHARAKEVTDAAAESI